VQPFPHHYAVSAVVAPTGVVRLESAGLTPLHTALPAEFGGRGDQWSPETLLVAAVADCYGMTFRGIAAASRLPWISFTCQVTGKLDRIDGVTRFTSFDLRAELQVPENADRNQATRILTRAEETCLITRSLSATVHLDANVETVSAVLA
jgi:organic hydroperoxide reductase OsmC/OhrA